MVQHQYDDEPVKFFYISDVNQEVSEDQSYYYF